MPLSYLIYFDAIKGLPEPVRTRLFAQVRGVLQQESGAVAYPHLNKDQRVAILSILQATYPDVLQ